MCAAMVENINAHGLHFLNLCLYDHKLSTVIQYRCLVEHYYAMSMISLLLYKSKAQLRMSAWYYKAGADPGGVMGVKRPPLQESY